MPDRDLAIKPWATSYCAFDALVLYREVIKSHQKDNSHKSSLTICEYLEYLSSYNRNCCYQTSIILPTIVYNHILNAITSTKIMTEKVPTSQHIYKIYTFLMTSRKSAKRCWLTHPQLTSLSKPNYIRRKQEVWTMNQPWSTNLLLYQKFDGIS